MSHAAKGIAYQLVSFWELDELGKWENPAEQSQNIKVKKTAKFITNNVILAWENQALSRFRARQ